MKVDLGRARKPNNCHYCSWTVVSIEKGYITYNFTITATSSITLIIVSIALTSGTISTIIFVISVITTAIISINIITIINVTITTIVSISIIAIYSMFNIEW